MEVFRFEHGAAFLVVELGKKRNREKEEGPRPPIYRQRGAESRRHGLTAPHDRGNRSGKKGNCHTHGGHTNQTVTSGTNRSHSR